MMRMLRWVGIGLLLAATAGCIKVDQTLTLDRDGSGSLDIRYGMSEQTIAQIKAMEQMSRNAGEGIKVEQESPFEFDEATVRKEFEADKPQGVELVSVSSELVDGWKYIDLKLSFDDLDALKKTEIFKNSKLRLKRDDEGNYTLVQKSAGGSDVNAGDAPMQEQMAAMFAGLRIVNTVVVPGEIIKTNATSVDGQRASWVFDIEQDPNVLAKLETTDLTVTFSGQDLDLAP